MSQATRTPTTSCRAAPCAVPVDAELVRLCHAIHASRDAVDALLETRLTIADERRTDPALTRLVKAEDRLLRQLWEVAPPGTAPGAVAFARLALRLAGAGEVTAKHLELLDGAGWIAADALRFLAEQSL